MLTCIGIAAAVSDIQHLMGPEADNRNKLLEVGNITLMCDNSLFGNPTPIISWLDNNESSVFDRTCICISGSTILSTLLSLLTYSDSKRDLPTFAM